MKNAVPVRSTPKTEYILKKGVSIFTPTYNRAYILPVLYESLKRQTNKEFEWIIVDDGSTDETKELVSKFIQEGKVDIKYYYQKNSGKHIAHNLGVKKAGKTWFTCIDSDDYLVDFAVQQIIDLETEAKNCIGMVFARGYSNKVTLTKWKGKKRRSTLYDAYNKYGLKGDTMLVYRSNIIKKVKFCKINGEKFVPESYLYDQLDAFGPMLMNDKILCICKYLPDGYTMSMRKIIYNNPLGYEIYIKQRLILDKTLKSRFLDSIRYIAIKLVLKDRAILKDSIYPVISIFALIPGWIFYEKAYKKYLETKS